MAITNPKPHFVLVPLMAQGHMIPMVDIARLLADRGAVVSFITTPVNASNIRPLITHVNQSGLPIKFVELPFPATEAGLPAGCENFDLIPPGYSFRQFYLATTLLKKPLELYLRNHPHPGPTVIIHDHCHPWTLDVARKLGNIPRLIFSGTSAFYLLYNHNLKVPPFFSGPGWEDARDAAIEADATAVGMLMNSFDELESGFMDSFRKGTGKKVWAIGPLSLYNKDDASKAMRGYSVDEQLVSSWLGSKEPNSVIYVSFGTMAHTRPSQLREIGLGLEATNRPFIWVIKEKSPEIDRWLSGGFEERTKGRGLIIKGWAPQVMILSHPAVGGFVTHCGWNSTLEAVSAGVPMVTWPRSTDQFINEKLVVEVLRVGVEISENDEVVVRKSYVEKAVVRLMDEGEEGKKRRERARELGEKARKAMEEGGSSYENLTGLIQYFSGC